MLGTDRPVILHVVNSLDGGGTERTLIRLLGELDRATCRHVVITLREAGSLANKLPPDIPCRALGTPGDARCLGFALAAVVREHRAVAIHARNTCCWADATIAKLLVPRIRLVLGFHGLEQNGPFSWRDRLVARTAGWIGARFLTPSTSGAAKLMRELGIAQARIRTIHNGVDVPDDLVYDGAALRTTRARWSLTEREIVIGTVGSLTPVKRHDLLVEAFARVRTRCPRAHLVLVGDGPLRETILNLTRTLHVEDAVTLTGWQDDVPALLRAMDIYACTSDSEGMSNALLEALAAGLPVVATDVGDNPIVVRPGRDGLIVPPTEVNALATALLELAEAQDRRSHFARAARRRAQRYRFCQTVRGYDAYYRALTAPTVGSPGPEAAFRSVPVATGP